MKIDLEAERKEILHRYKELIKACKRRLEKGDKEIVRKALIQYQNDLSLAAKALGMSRTTLWRYRKKFGL